MSFVLTTNMAEDDIYRTSTQYRLWSFTQESLASLRSSTNSSAADSVRAAVQKLSSAKPAGKDGDATDGKEAPEVDCLTVEEEQKLVGYYCVKAMQFADFCEFPTNVKATAVQYLKRFYLYNSPMTYHPKELMPSALFLSTKTENNYISLRHFSSKLPKTTAEDIVAPEFLLTQGLRFTFDVRHPQRGLEGGIMELMALANGKGHPPASNNALPAQLQEEMLKIDPAKEGKPRSKTPADLVTRVQSAHAKSRDILKTSALLSDAYFHFTPSQIWLSALLLSDPPLCDFYLNTKLPAPSLLKPKLLTTLHSCAGLLRTSASANPGEAEIKGLTGIDKKLYKCRNPEKIDLVGINKAQKREGKAEDGLDEKAVKKRKLERAKEERESEEVFGPVIAKKNPD